MGHPVVGDRRFGDHATNRHFEETHTLDRLFLHCTRLSSAKASLGTTFETPTDASIHCPLSDELAALLAKFDIDAAGQLMIG